MGADIKDLEAGFNSSSSRSVLFFLAARQRFPSNLDKILGGIRLPAQRMT